MADAEALENADVVLPSATTKRTRVVKTDAEASAAYGALSPDEHDAFWKMADSGVDKKHALNLVRAGRGEAAAVASVDAANAQRAPSLADKARATAVNAGDAATGGGLSTLSALATSLPDFRPDFLRKHTISFGDGSGGGTPIDEQKEDNAKVLGDVQAKMPFERATGTLAGLLAPLAGGALGAGGGAAAAAPSIGKSALQGAGAGGGFGALSGLLNPHSHDAGDYAKNTALPALIGALTGGAFGGAGGLNTALKGSGGNLMDALGVSATDPPPPTPSFGSPEMGGAPAPRPSSIVPSLVKGAVKHFVPGGKIAVPIYDALSQAAAGAGADVNARPAGVLPVGAMSGDTQPNMASPSGLDLARAPGMSSADLADQLDLLKARAGMGGRADVTGQIRAMQQAAGVGPSGLDLAREPMGTPPDAPPPGIDLYPTSTPPGGMRPPVPRMPRGAGLNFGAAPLTSPSGLDLGLMDPSVDDVMGAIAKGPSDASPVPDVNEPPPSSTPADLSFLRSPSPSPSPSPLPHAPGSSPVPDLAEAAFNAGTTPPAPTSVSPSPFADTTMRPPATPAPGVAPVFRGEPTPVPGDPTASNGPFTFGGRHVMVDPESPVQFGGVPLRRATAADLPDEMLMAGPSTSNMRAPGALPSPSGGALQPNLFGDGAGAVDETTQPVTPWNRHAVDDDVDALMAQNPAARDFLRSSQQYNPANRVHWQDAHDSTRAAESPTKGAMHGRLAGHGPPRSGAAWQDPFGQNTQERIQMMLDALLMREPPK